MKHVANHLSDRTTLLKILGLATAYFIVAKTSLAFATLPGGVTPVWFPAGVALGGALLLGNAVLPAVVLAGLLLHTGSHGMTPTHMLGGLSIGCGNMLAVAVQVWLLRWHCRRQQQPLSRLLNRTQTIVWFVVVAIFTPPVSAAIGVTTLCTTEIVPWSVYGTLYWTWSTSNSFGILIVTPLFLSWLSTAEPLTRLSWQRWLEVTILAILLTGISRLAFWQSVPSEYMLIPLLVWAVFRFGQRGATLIVVVVSVIAILGIVYSFQVDPDRSRDIALLFLQSFVGVVTLTTLILSATVLERRQAEAELKQANQDLQGMALQLQASNLALEQANEELEQRVKERTAALQSAQQQSEELLLNILPSSIADRLKQAQSSIADGFEEVTVMFADIVNFTNLSSQVSPQELVQLLNHIFSTFDLLSEQYPVEKIKTIGDAYMVVSGLPTPYPSHAEAIADMALAMQAAIKGFISKDGRRFRIRIGINTGPVVAGVIGTKKFIYDLWGDTVNIASRMESHGVPGQIQVTAATYERLKHLYDLEERGKVSIKGRGEMMTYWLKGKKHQTIG
jgi:class 3 adenylate cyclase/integral membrane sensor domain MASE1